MADQEKSKGFSLRKKNERRLPPQEKDRPSPPADRSRNPRRENYERDGDVARPRETSQQRLKARGATSDFVKKRYSVRYNQPPNIGNGDASATPGVPKIPQDFLPGGTFEDSAFAPKSRGLDQKTLMDPQLDSEQHATSFLSNATEQGIADYQRSLVQMKDRASTELQQNLFQNRTQFIKISKEAEKLRGEMQTLRGLMAELTTTLAATSGRRSPTFDDSNNANINRRKMNRSSVANLEAMWNTQLQTLWKNIEGSQKFLPATPGRHVVQESGFWVELDAATWRPRQSVHLVLLNDYLLVATKRRKRLDPSLSPSTQKISTKPVAERCWPLQDIDILDLLSESKDIKGYYGELNDVTNAITVRHGQESFTYRSDRPDSKEKNSLLLDFRRTVDELRRVERADVDEIGKNQNAMNYLAARDPAIFYSQGLLRSLSKSKDRPEFFIDVDGKQRDFRWVEGQIDDLDIEVALQRFEDAVTHVEQLRKLVKGLKGNPVAQDLITLKVDERASKLADLITQRLTATHNFPTQTLTNTAYLTRLSLPARARIVYLAARSAIIQKRARGCVFEGDLVTHITQVSFVYFILIKNTVNVYQQCFPPPMMSACVVWAKDRLDEFNEVLERGLSSVSRDGEVWRQCLSQAREMAGMIEEVGLDFAGLVGAGLKGERGEKGNLEDGGGLVEGLGLRV